MPPALGLPPESTFPELNEIREQLTAIRNSPGFRTSPTLGAILDFCVEKTLAGERDQLKEYTIAVCVLHRREDFDPRYQSIVRTQVGRLREKLVEYYHVARPGSYSVLIEFDKGTYIPRISRPVPAGPDAPHLAAVRMTLERTIRIQAPRQQGSNPVAAAELARVATLIQDTVEADKHFVVAKPGSAAEQSCRFTLEAGIQAEDDRLLLTARVFEVSEHRESGDGKDPVAPRLLDSAACRWQAEEDFSFRVRQVVSRLTSAVRMRVPLLPGPPEDILRFDRLNAALVQLGSFRHMEQAARRFALSASPADSRPASETSAEYWLCKLLSTTLSGVCAPGGIEEASCYLSCLADEQAPLNKSLALTATRVLQSWDWREGLDFVQLNRAALSVDNVAAVFAATVFCLPCGEFEQAAWLYGQVEAREPASALAHAGLGWCALGESRYADAEEHFDEALLLCAGQEWAMRGMRRVRAYCQSLGQDNSSDAAVPSPEFPDETDDPIDPPAIQKAMDHALAGETVQAMSILENLVRRRDPEALWVGIDPFWRDSLPPERYPRLVHFFRHV